MQRCSRPRIKFERTTKVVCWETEGCTIFVLELYPEKDELAGLLNPVTNHDDYMNKKQGYG